MSAQLKSGPRPDYPVVGYRSFTEALHAAHEALLSGARLVLLTGAPGSGRSYLLQRLAARLRQDGHFCQVRRPSVFVNPVSMYDLVDDVAESDIQAILTADEARPHCLMVVSEETAAMIAGIVPTCPIITVPPLNTADVRTFLLQRCVQFGMPQDRFTAEAMQRLADASEGNPLLLDDLTGQAVRRQIAVASQHVTAEIVEFVAGGGQPAPVAQPQPQPLPQPLPEPEPLRPAAVVAMPVPKPEPVPMEPDPVPEPVPEPVLGSIPEPVPEPVPEPIPERVPEPVPEPVLEIAPKLEEARPEPVVQAVAEPSAPEQRQSEASAAWAVLYGLQNGGVKPRRFGRRRVRARLAAVAGIVLLAAAGTAGWPWLMPKIATVFTEGTVDAPHSAPPAGNTNPASVGPRADASTASPVQAASAARHMDLNALGEVLKAIGQSGDSKAILRHAESQSPAPATVR